MSKRHLLPCRNTPVHVAITHCGFSPQPSRLCFAAPFNMAISGKHLPSQLLCRRQVTFLNPHQSAREEETSEAQQIPYCAVCLARQQAEEGEVNKPHPQERMPAGNSRDRLGQEDTISPQRAQLRLPSTLVLWPGTPH